MVSFADIIARHVLLSRFCEFLTIQDICRIGLLSKRINQIIEKSPFAWKQVFLKEWGGIYPSAHHYPSHFNWKEAFGLLDKPRQAALKGRWFEYDGYFLHTEWGFKFRMVLHSVEQLRSSYAVPNVPEEIMFKDSLLIAEQEEFRENPTRHCYQVNIPPHKPKGNIMNSAYEWPSYPNVFDKIQHSYLENTDPKFYNTPPNFGTVPFESASDSISLANKLIRYGYRNFFPTVLPSELFVLRHHHLYATTNPAQRMNELIPIEGVIHWSVDVCKDAKYDFAIGVEAQEIVQGYYNVKTRMIYLLGVGLNLKAIDAFVGIDAVKLQVSEDGHSVVGNTLSPGSTPAWSTKMKGATKQSRDGQNVCTAMRSELEREMEVEMTSKAKATQSMPSAPMPPFIVQMQQPPQPPQQQAQGIGEQGLDLFGLGGGDY